LCAAVLSIAPLAARAEDDAGAAAAAPAAEADAGAALQAAPPDAGEAKEEAAPPEDPNKVAARQVVTEYLEAVKAKKWDAARKLIHPKTLERIAAGKKRRGIEDDEMAPWAKVKESYLVAFELGEPTPSAKGAMVVASTEQVYSVEDKGTEDGVKVDYLVLPLGGKWYVTDRRLGENEFPADTLALAYKGYFEGEYVPATPPPPEKKKHKKKGD
jgi:ribosome-binding protein aMBF1 (putative translation factor)